MARIHSDNFYENYIDLCLKNGKYPTVVAEELGLSRSAVSKWRKGGMPTDRTLAAIAVYFGCKTEDLIGDKVCGNDGLQNEAGGSVPKKKAAKSILINRITQMDDETAEYLLRVAIAADIIR